MIFATDYGVVADGATDDTPAMQAVIAASALTGNTMLYNGSGGCNRSTDAFGIVNNIG